MKTIAQIYSDFRIMPNLQLHQLRVAAVAKTVCNRFTFECDTAHVVVACLIHDMGNIIKSKLDRFPAWTEAADLKYWEQVKRNFIAQYGEDERAATLAIARELASVVTLKPATCGRLKTGQRDWPKTDFLLPCRMWVRQDKIRQVVS